MTSRRTSGSSGGPCSVTRKSPATHTTSRRRRRAVSASLRRGGGSPARAPAAPVTEPGRAGRAARPQVGVGCERVRLPSAAVEPEHQLRPQRLAQRMLGHERLELADQAGMAAEGEVGVDARAQAPGAAPPAARRRRRERLVAHVLQRRTAPELERAGERPPCRVVLAPGERVVALAGELLEAIRVEIGVERQPVPARPEGDRLVAEHPAQARHDDLQRVAWVHRERVAPERLDRDVRRHHPRRVEQQQREQAQRPAGAPERAAVIADRLDGPQDPELAPALPQKAATAP